jgi:hypothetical protein
MSELDKLIKGDLKPEDVFSLVTVMPKKKIKVTAYLEDSDGDRILVADIAENLVKYITEQMQLQESTPVNSQMFPLCASFMLSIVPRFVGIEASMFLFGGAMFREAMLHLTLASTLFMQYIEQHGLKVVTETTNLTDAEVEKYHTNASDMDERFRKFFSSGDEDDND